MAAMLGSKSLARAPRLALSCPTIACVVAIVEATMIVVGSASGPRAYHWAVSLGDVDTQRTLCVGVMSGLSYVSIAWLRGFYRFPVLIDPLRHLRGIAAVCGYVLLWLAAMFYLLKIGSDFSRGESLGFAALMLLLCVLTRLGAADVIAALMARGCVLGRNAVLIGEAQELASITPPTLLRRFGLTEVGRVVIEAPATGHGHEWTRRVEDAVRLARVGCAKEVVVAARFDSVEDLSLLQNAFRVTPLPVRLLPDRVLRSLADRPGSPDDAGLRMVELRRPPLGLAETVAKRLVDILGASFGLLALAPLMVATAIAIKLDSSGPVIFRQRRNGFNQGQFWILKFRTMTCCEDGAGVVQAKRGDKRVTPVGRVLRRTSIDELPQLLNVLRGEMSLVGPRPHALAHDDHYGALISDYCMRHHMKPGITGWAQVNGQRGETARTEDMERRIALDLWYTDNWSFSLDLRILFRTCIGVLHHEAY